MTRIKTVARRFTNNGELRRRLLRKSKEVSLNMGGLKRKHGDNQQQVKNEVIQEALQNLLLESVKMEESNRRSKRIIEKFSKYGTNRHYPIPI